MLYGSSSWVMTGHREAELRTTQLKMLRTLVGTQRKVLDVGILEEWIDWIKRATDIVRNLMEVHGVAHWGYLQTNQTQKWHETINSMESNRWAARVLQWQPVNTRSQGRPMSRWEDQACFRGP